MPQFNLTNEQDALFQEFKEKLQQEFPEEDEHTFLRFLKARKFHLQNAELMYRKCAEWRAEYKVDEKGDFEPHEVFVKYGSGDIVAYDKEDCPMFLCWFGQLDVDGILKCCTMEEIYEYIMFGIIERVVLDLKKQTKKLGRIVGQAVVLLDFENLPIRSLLRKDVLSLMARFARSYEANYPERLKHAYIINAPMLFTLVWNLVFKITLAEETLNKISIYGYNDLSWQDKFFQEFDKSQIPQYWGGTRVGKNGCDKCSDIFKMGSQVPSKYYVM